MKFVGYLRSLIGTDTGDSSKSFALVMSVFTSFITSLVICFAIIYDVVSNGYIKTDLEPVGIFVLCVGASVAGSGIPKIFGDREEEKTRIHRIDRRDVTRGKVRNFGVGSEEDEEEVDE